MYILKAKYPPFLWQCRSYFPPTLPLECLSMASPAPSLDATKHRAGTTSRDTRTHIPTEMVPGRPQTCYHTAPLSGTSIATISPNHCPAPRLIDPASGQASPAQLCVIQPRPGSPSIHTIHSIPLHISHTIISLITCLWMDGGLGLTAGLSPHRPCHGHLLGEPKESERNGCVRLPASQLALPRAVVSKNAVPCRRTLTHCHRAVQCD